jgi:multiple sugar transport system permease protein
MAHPASLVDKTKTRHTRARAWQRMKRALIPYTFLAPTLLLLVVLSLIPIGTVLYYSVLDNVIITPDDPSFVGLDNYVQILSSSAFRQALRNTLVFASISVLGHFALGLSFALLLNSDLMSPITKAVFRAIYILPWVFTASVIAILWRLLLNPHGPVNFLLLEAGLVQTRIEWLSSRTWALTSVTFINIWAGYPFFMVSFLAGLQGIRAELYEAARIDGAASWQVFRYITLPQLKPIIISLALLDFIWTTHQFALIWMTTGGGPIRASEMLSTFTYKMAFGQNQFALASAVATLTLLMTAFVGVFYVRAQKRASE